MRGRLSFKGNQDLWDGRGDDDGMSKRGRRARHELAAGVGATPIVVDGIVISIAWKC